MRKILFFVVAASLSFSAFSQSNVYLKINHLLGSTPFVFNATTSNNFGDIFNVDRLEYYISSIAIHHDGGTITNIPNTWILANASSQVYELLGNYNIITIEKITFSIGVETPTNHNDPSLYAMSHALAPKSPSMHWGWTAGYRFIAMEGLEGTSSTNQPYELHGLGDTNYFSQTILTEGMTDANGLVIELNADYEQAVKDINIASGVISHGEVNEAKKIVENFRDHVFNPVNSTVSIGDLNNENVFKIYPNPTSSNREISYEYNGEFKNGIVEITDLRGRIIQTKQAKTYKNVLISHLDVGVYLVSFKSDSGKTVMTKKLIINK